MDIASVGQLIDKLAPDQLNELIADLDRGLKDYIFVPNPGPQTEAFDCQADELFYGGAAGGGKTALICGLAMQSHHRSLILRRTYPQLGGIFDECERILGNKNGFREQKKLWYLTKDRRIDFGSVQYDADKENYQGRPHDLIAFDEITQFTKSIYSYIIRWNRSANPKQRCRVLVTGNPPMTAEGRWVIEYWAAWLDPAHPKPAKPGELRWYTVNDKGDEVECNGPDHIPPGCSDKPRSRTFIQARLEDNPDYMATGYGSVLAGMPEPHRTQLREGRFDITEIDAEHQVIPTSWLLQAQQRWHGNSGRHYQMNAVGVDVAQGGKDKTVFAPRRGHYYDQLFVYKGIETPDGPAVVDRLLSVVKDRARIVVDAGGGYGGDTITQLWHAGQDARGFNGAQSAPANAMTRTGMMGFKNLRAYAYWSFREALDPDYGSMIALPPDSELVAQLSAATYEITPSGIKIESKADIKERLGVSPDKADAVIYAFWSDQPGLRKGRDPARKQRKVNRTQQTSY